MFSYSKIIHTLVICCFGLCITSCKTDSEKAASKNAQAHPKTGTKAKVILKPTKGNKVTGTVTFAVVSDGVKIVADIDGLTPGKHGFHVHEFGDCSAPDGSSAGGHFNPTKKDHGAPDVSDRHVGDLGNITADANGHAHFERIDKVIALKGENNVIGRSVIVHEKADDFSQPVGNAGSRLACGLIEVVE